MTTKKPVQTVVFRGKASYAKILGDPVLNYSKDGKEWKMDLHIVDKDIIKEAKALGIGDKVKQKPNYLNGDPHLSFKQAELRKDGTPNFPIKVFDAAGKPWPENKLIGNGSDVDVKFVIMDYGPGKNKGMYIRSVRVLRLEEYSPQEFAPIDEDDEFYDEAAAAEELDAQEARDEAVEVDNNEHDEDELDDDLVM